MIIVFYNSSWIDKKTFYTFYPFTVDGIQCETKGDHSKFKENDLIFDSYYTEGDDSKEYDPPFYPKHIEGYHSKENGIIVDSYYTEGDQSKENGIIVEPEHINGTQLVDQEGEAAIRVDALIYCRKHLVMRTSQKANEWFWIYQNFIYEFQV